MKAESNLKMETPIEQEPKLVSAPSVQAEKNTGQQPILSDRTRLLTHNRSTTESVLSMPDTS